MNITSRSATPRATTSNDDRSDIGRERELLATWKPTYYDPERLRTANLVGGAVGALVGTVPALAFVASPHVGVRALGVAVGVIGGFAGLFGGARLGAALLHRPLSTADEERGEQSHAEAVRDYGRVLDRAEQALARTPTAEERTALWSTVIDARPIGMPSTHDVRATRGHDRG